MSKHGRRRPYEMVFYEDRNGKWRARIKRTGMKDVVVEPQADRLSLFAAAIRTLNQAELNPIMAKPFAPGERPLVVEPPEGVIAEASKNLWGVMHQAVTEAVQELGPSCVAQVVSIEDIMEGVGVLLVGHKGEKLARVTAAFDPRAHDYDFNITYLDSDGQRGSKKGS